MTPPRAGQWKKMKARNIRAVLNTFHSHQLQLVATKMITLPFQMDMA
uniref:Uncharacterized protein n=1 Tax=Arundo donax TaxID=35708 RepID=A0A0A9FFU1_ARUDO